MTIGDKILTTESFFSDARIDRERSIGVISSLLLERFDKVDPEAIDSWVQMQKRFTIKRRAKPTGLKNDIGQRCQSYEATA